MGSKDIDQYKWSRSALYVAMIYNSVWPYGWYSRALSKYAPETPCCVAWLNIPHASRPLDLDGKSNAI